MRFNKSLLCVSIVQLNTLLPCGADVSQDISTIAIDKNILSSLKIDGMNSEIESAARFSIRNSKGIYVISSKKSDNNYGVVFLEKYMSGLSDESKLIKGISRQHMKKILKLMDEALKLKKVSGWLILRYRSDGREFLGYYKGETRDIGTH